MTSSFSATTAGRHLVDLVEPRVLDDAAALLLEQVDGEDQPARHERRDRLDVNCGSIRKPGRVRRELARDRVLNSRDALVGVVEAAVAEHRAQRLALVHRDHHERAVRAGERRVTAPRRARSPRRDARGRCSRATTDRSGRARAGARRRRACPAPCRTSRSAARAAIVPRPTETPCVGTSSSDANSGNVARLSRRVLSASATTRGAAVARRARRRGRRRGRPTRPRRAGRGRCRRRLRSARRRRRGRRRPAATRAPRGMPSGPAISRGAKPRQL